jgi:hypothetical protein
MDQISARRKKKLVAGRYFIYRISQNKYTRYKTNHRNLRPITTWYWILVPRYKSTADIEDFKQL